MSDRIGIDEVTSAREGAKRRLEIIRREMSRLEDEAAELNAEMADYETTLQTLQRIADRLKSSSDEDGSDDVAHGRMRKFIETALNTVGRDGITAALIRDYIQKRHNTEIPPNTVSVTLNRLKKNGLARLDGMEWYPASPTLPSWDAPAPSELDDDIPF